MRVSHERTAPVTLESAVDRLKAFIAGRRSSKEPRRDTSSVSCMSTLRAGIVEGRWTPLAARQAAFVVAHLTSQEGEDLFRELGNRDYMDVMLWGGTG